MCKRRNKARKSAFVLLEVLIATTLFLILITAIFAIFWRTNKVNNAIQKLRTANEQLLLAQARLQDVFGRSDFADTFRPYFYLEQNKRAAPSLVFTFDNRLQADPFFANGVLGKLYLDDDKLCLATWPHVITTSVPPTKMRKEVLLEDVSDLHFEFFLAPQSQDPELQESEQEEGEEQAKKAPSGRWVTIWLKEYNRSPTLMKMTLSKKGFEDFVLWFFIPSEISPVLYNKL